MIILESIIAFVAMFVTDICWAVYVVSVKNDDAFRSSLWALFLFLCGSVAVIGYTSNPWLLIPAGAGAFAGTYAGVLMNRNK